MTKLTCENEKAYDRVDREALWNVLYIYGVGGQLLTLSVWEARALPLDHARVCVCVIHSWS